MDELEVSHLSYFAFDAVLVLAQALNDTWTGWSNNSPDWSFCERENEVNRTSLTKCFIRRKIQNINIAGLTVSFKCSYVTVLNKLPLILYMQGEISFNPRGNRVTHKVGLYQYRIQGELQTRQNQYLNLQVPYKMSLNSKISSTYREDLVPGITKSLLYIIVEKMVH